MLEAAGDVLGGALPAAGSPAASGPAGLKAAGGRLRGGGQAPPSGAGDGKRRSARHVVLVRTAAAR
jgi:hypothetical protein